MIVVIANEVFGLKDYRIWLNYRTHHYKHAVKQFCSLQITTSVLVDAIQMSSHNMCFYKENQIKKSHKRHQINSLLIFFFKFILSK